MHGTEHPLYVAKAFTMTQSPQEHFASLVVDLTAWLQGRQLNPALGEELNRAFPPESDLFRGLAAACTSGLEDGWLGNRGEPPLRYGRAIKPSPATHGFSIDVVLMSDVAGPEHVHPNGEIDMVVPIDPTARFEGHGAGWVVFAPGSVHAPTVVGGSAAVLYALPDGAIRF
jgi:Domain of unknown function (DUF4863)